MTHGRGLDPDTRAGGVRYFRACSGCSGSPQAGPMGTGESRQAYVSEQSKPADTDGKPTKLEADTPLTSKERITLATASSVALIMLGQAGVGKTSLYNQFCIGMLTETLTTLG